MSYFVNNVVKIETLLQCAVLASYMNKQLIFQHIGVICVDVCHIKLVSSIKVL